MGLVVPGGVQDEIAQQLSGFLGHDPNVQIVDEQQHPGPSQAHAHPDVMQPRVVPERELAQCIDAVAPQPMVRCQMTRCSGRRCLGARVEGGRRGSASQRPVWTHGVVVAGEPVQLDLQRFDVIGSVLLGQVALECLMEALDLAAGLRVIRRGVDHLDPAQRAPLRSRSSPHPARVACQRTPGRCR